MAKIAIIPARGGSKRIPKKNIKLFLGKPIIAYSIEAALDSNLFDEVMVSTDSKEIANIAEQYGASVPFYRSSENSSDYSTTVDVLLEVISQFKLQGRYFEQGCCIYPSAPLVTKSLINNCYNTLEKGNWDTVFPGVEYNHPIDRAFFVKKQGGMVMINDDNKLKRTQDLEQAFYDSGQLYWFKTDKLILKKTLFTDNTGVVKVSEMDVQYIDTLVDFTLAEMKYNYQRNVS